MGNDKLGRLLEDCGPYDADGLYQSVLRRVDKERRRALRWRLGAMSILAVVAFGGLVVASGYTLRALSQSGFYQYVSLLSSDRDIAVAHLQEFVLSLIESVPLLYVTASLFAIFILMFLVNVIVNTLKSLPTPKVHSYQSHAHYGL